MKHMLQQIMYKTTSENRIRIDADVPDISANKHTDKQTNGQKF